MNISRPQNTCAIATCSRTPQIGKDFDAPGRVRIRGPLTPKQIASLLGVSPQTIHHAERRAMWRMLQVLGRDGEKILEALHG